MFELEIETSPRFISIGHSAIAAFSEMLGVVRLRLLLSGSNRNLIARGAILTGIVNFISVVRETSLKIKLCRRNFPRDVVCFVLSKHRSVFYPNFIARFPKECGTTADGSMI